MFTMILVLSLLGLFSSSGAQLLQIGQCDLGISLEPDFKVEQFQGTWHEIEAYPKENQRGQCINHVFSQGTGNTLNLQSSSVVDQFREITASTVAFDSTDNSGRLVITLNSNGTVITIPFWVLSTDYNDYALVYSCVNIDSNFRSVWSWKLSRTRSLTTNAVSAINRVLDSIDVLNDRYYYVVDNSPEGCFYFPEPNGNAVRFRGQCDETIPVVNNFNVDAYLGPWYDIESYPQEFQDGTCATADVFSLGANGVGIYNTQVVNQQLDISNGTAVVASTDGSAKLLVTFPIAGTNLTISTPYWVLATDYSSYSLVYSCANINEEYRSVTSWKLSRQQSLTADANTAINAVMDTIPVLRQEYFEVTGHTETDCFYYPDNFGGPVILDGQCPSASEVDVVNNFNIQAFDGTWHEISRFPSELQSNKISSNYVVSNTINGYAATQSSVSNEMLITSTGPAVVSNDGRGIIATTLNGNGLEVNLTLYILATDYTEYALAYSCVNVGYDTKQIYSWKFSRSRDGLSEAANNVFNQVVSNNVDLFEGYYENTDARPASMRLLPEQNVLFPE